MGDLTKNFSIAEFRPYSSNIYWTPESIYQRKLIEILAKELQNVRDLVVKAPMKIISGVREFSDYQRLLNQNYNPSKTSDHFFSNVIPIEDDNPKYLIFGRYYFFSVGAVDIQVNNIEANFKKIIKLDKEKKVRFGQVIWERSSDGKKEWLHLSNDHSRLLGKPIMDLLKKEKYLKSTDNGKTYQKVSA